MLFKRKSGKDNSNGTRRSWAGKDGVQPGENGAVGNNWRDEKVVDDSVASEDKKKAARLDDTQRAVAQRRASKKMASIDWDIAAREEITALLNNGSKESANPPGADNDLEAVRKAIARRKSLGETLSKPDPKVSNPSVEIPENPTDDIDSEENGPRLDWLVDFISDDPSTSAPNNTEDNAPSKRPGQSAKNNGSQSPNVFTDIPAEDHENIDLGRSVSGQQSTGIKPISSFPPDLTIGDGFGGIELVDPEESNKPNNPRSPAEQSRNRTEKPKRIPPPKKKSTPPSSKSSNQTEPLEVKDDLPEYSQNESSSDPLLKKTVPTPGTGNFKTKDRVVGLLLRKQVVNMSQVYEAQKLKERENQKEALWRILVELNGVDKDAIYEEAARIYAFPVADVEGKLDAKFVRSVLETLSEENRDLLLNLHLVPYESQGDGSSGSVKLAFITHDPMRTEVRRVMKELKLDRFDLFYAPKSAVDSIINEAFPRKNEYLERMNDDSMAFDLGMSYEDADIIDEDALEAEISRSSLINLFEATLVEAVRQGASDVHIYPNAKKKVEIHFRVDGRLTLWHTEHKVHPEALLAVIKDNAMNVDRFERDAAQDGYIQRWIDDVLIRFRVSVLPIANISHEIRSESIVIRVLDDRKVIRDLRKLGLLEEAMKKFEQAISQPHGMVILTGPTGSGKSTTLVAALHQVITGEVNVLTVEDPVEYIIPGVRQIKLNYKLELENALRAILRHDPDVVMVGEMRDRKTAELAIKLANTGHLTFSTLHTNDAPSAISRLYKMGIEPFLIAYAINLIVAQRLIRILCTNCKQPDLDPDPIMLERLGFTKEEISSTTFYLPGKDSDCPVCKGVGYKGRRAVSEALYFSREVRHMIVEADKMIDEGAIKKQAVKEGMLTLRDSAREIVKLGQTSVREMIRVVTTDG